MEGDIMTDLMQIRSEQIKDIKVEQIVFNNTPFTNYINKYISIFIPNCCWLSNTFTYINENITSDNGQLFCTATDQSEIESLLNSIITVSTVNTEDHYIVFSCKTQPAKDLHLLLILN
jgi:hypothetical protein